MTFQVDTANILSNSAAVGTSSVGVTNFSTAVAGEVLIALVATATSGGYITTSTWTSTGVTWTLRKREQFQFTPITTVIYVTLEEWYATPSGSLTNETITANLSGTMAGSGQGAAITVFGIEGANTTTPFDPNSSLPSAGETNTASANGSFSTTEANTIAFLAEVGQSIGVPSGTTLIGDPLLGGGNEGRLDSFFKAYTSAQTNNTNFVLSSAPNWAWITDAVQEAASADIANPVVTNLKKITQTFDAISGTAAAITTTLKSITQKFTAVETGAHIAQTFPGFGKATQKLLMNNAPLPLDGIAWNFTNSGDTVNATLTTLQSADTIIVSVATVTAGSSSPSVTGVSGGGLGWSRRTAVNSQAPFSHAGSEYYNSIEEWFTVSPVPVTNLVITATINANLSGNFTGGDPGNGPILSILAFGLPGLNTQAGNPYDPNVSLPIAGVQSTDTNVTAEYSTNEASTYAVLFMTEESIDNGPTGATNLLTLQQAQGTNEAGTYWGYHQGWILKNTSVQTNSQNLYLSSVDAGDEYIIDAFDLSLTDATNIKTTLAAITQTLDALEVEPTRIVTTLKAITQVLTAMTFDAAKITTTLKSMAQTLNVTEFEPLDISNALPHITQIFEALEVEPNFIITTLKPIKQVLRADVVPISTIITTLKSITQTLIAAEIEPTEITTTLRSISQALDIFVRDNRIGQITTNLRGFSQELAGGTVTLPPITGGFYSYWS